MSSASSRSTRPVSLALCSPSSCPSDDQDFVPLQKLQAVKAFQAGHLPSNAQVDSFLVRAIEHHFVQRDKLSPASRQVEEDFNVQIFDSFVFNSLISCY